MCGGGSGNIYLLATTQKTSVVHDFASYGLVDTYPYTQHIRRHSIFVDTAFRHSLCSRWVTVLTGDRAIADPRNDSAELAFQKTKQQVLANIYF